MKKLQCNFTTQEQSKLLLELGVPAWTADCFRWDFSSAFGISEDKRYSTSISLLCYEYQRDFHDKLPCWSVGRLIEILNICSMYMFFTLEGEELLGASNIEQAIKKLQEHVRDKTIDFSKLEE